MILSQAQARELGEALLDAVEAVIKTKIDQAVVILGHTAVAVPFNKDIQAEYETPIIIQV